MGNRIKENIIKVSNLSFYYDEGTCALQDISFEVSKGEFVGFLASNGGGKTTLLRCLTRLLEYDKGTVEYSGTDLKKMSHKLLIRKIGLCFQNPLDQLLGTTVYEDAAYGPRNLGFSREEVRENVENALEQVGLTGLESKPIHHLSFGQQKRLCIAGILAMGPETLILDEPTAGLDPEGETSIMKLLGKLNKENGITIIMATHLIDLLPLFLDRIYVIKKGKIAFHGEPTEVFSKPEIMKSAHLRIPYITSLIEELRNYDHLPVNGHPLTIGEARLRLVDMLTEYKK